MVKHFTVLGYEFKNVFLMTELNVKIEIRKTAIQRKEQKSGLSEFSQIQSINGAKIDPWCICTGDIDND